MSGKFHTIVDSAWGSSAKGAASVRLAEVFNFRNLSSCNFPNAGHTTIINGEKFVSKSLPTGALLKKQKNIKDIKLWVGCNSGFERNQLQKEIDQCEILDENLIIHERAMVVEQRHIDAESPTGSQSTEHISSTMSGSGAAYTEKVMRKKEVNIAKNFYPNSLNSKDFFYKVKEELYNKNDFLHEVSQGFALSVNHGTHYPTCTFRDATPQQAYADFGIKKDDIGDVYLNVRSFPIRVGNNYKDGIQVGYSGDCLSDQIETSWEQVGRDAEMPDEEIFFLAEKERTTVTKKIRRVFTPSWELLKWSADFCGATKLILNFPQYIHWSSFGIKGGEKEFKILHQKVRSYIDKMEEVTNLKVVMIGTSANHEDFIYRG